MNPSLFFEVFNPLALVYAISAGVAFGASAILYISLKYPPKTPMTTIRLAAVTALAAASAGTLFFAGQIVPAYLTDPLWPRALARMSLWEVFSLSIGVGLAVARSFASRVER